MSEVLLVSYYRVSTARQGQSGLGLEAQKFAVHGHIKSSGGVLLAEYTEIESGRRKNRPQLAAALELCRRRRASLVIAKLDRLARSVAFVSALLESGVRFLALDLPECDVSFLQMASVFAEWEARKVSERTKAALAAAKARGRVLGWAMPSRHDEQRRAAIQGAAECRRLAYEFAANTMPLVQSIQRAGVTTLAGVAGALNARGIKTRAGGKWHPASVRQLILRVDTAPRR